MNYTNDFIEGVMSAVRSTVAYLCGKNDFITEMDADDIVGDAIAKCLFNYEKFDSTKAQVSTWASKIATNCFNDKCNYKKKVSSLDAMIDSGYGKRIGDDEEDVIMGYENLMGWDTDDEYYCDCSDPESNYIAKEKREQMKAALSDALSDLSERDAQIMSCFMQGKKAPEIAKEMGCSNEAVYLVKCRAKKKLTKMSV